jgi:hypothetical protein
MLCLFDANYWHYFLGLKLKFKMSNFCSTITGDLINFNYNRHEKINSAACQRNAIINGAINFMSFHLIRHNNDSIHPWQELLSPL